ncbi:MULTISPECIES: hypothetical protein [Acidobacterium]|nr:MULTISPECIES: hypothetical protein [Acidobacterium]
MIGIDADFCIIEPKAHGSFSNIFSCFHHAAEGIAPVLPPEKQPIAEADHQALRMKAEN